MRPRPHRRILTALAVLTSVALAACGSSGRPASPRPTQRAALTSAAPTIAAATQLPTLALPETAPPDGTPPDGLDAVDWVGAWRGSESNEFGTATAETVLLADGSFTNLTSNPQFGSLVRSWGTWQIVAAADPFLRFDIDGHEPTEFCGPITCTPVLMPAGVSQEFLFLDRNTVLLWTSDCASRSCQVTYTRAG